MRGRRRFLRDSLLGAVSWVVVRPVATARGADQNEDDGTGTSEQYRVTRDVPTRLFDGKRCWCHPVAGIVEGAGKDGLPRVVMAMHTLDLDGSDVFKGTYGLRTDDLGASWTSPRESETLAPRFEIIDGQKCPVAASALWPRWHAALRRRSRY